MNKRYNELRQLTAHNAFANPEQGYPLPGPYTNQRLRIKAQLYLGVRGLMLDVYWKGDDIVCSHRTRPWIDVNPNIPLADLIKDVTDFMNLPDHKHEIVTIFFEDYLTEEKGESSKRLAKFDDILSGAGLLFDFTQYDIARDGWPTVEEMCRRNHRLVAFAQNSDTPRVPKLYKYAVETVYGNASLNIDTWTTNRAESNELTKPAKLCGIARENTLIIVNHFKEISAWLLTDYEGNINSEAFLKKHIDHFIWNTSRVPNFLAIDFIDVGRGQEALEYLENCPKTYNWVDGLSWTSFFSEGIDWDAEYLIPIPEGYYLTGVGVFDQPGYGITNLMVKGKRDYQSPGVLAEDIRIPGRNENDPNPCWVNDEFSGKPKFYTCSEGTYIDAIQIAKHHKWGIVNLRCHLKNKQEAEWEAWITDNEKENAERLSETLRMERIQAFHLKCEGGHGLVDLRYGGVAQGQEPVGLGRS